MSLKQLSGWQIVTRILVGTAVIAASAAALVLGKDALITIAVVFVVGAIVVAILNNL